MEESTMESSDLMAWCGLGIAIGAAYFKPVRATYKWCVAYAMLNSGSPLARTLAHKMGYTYNEHGWIKKMLPGEAADTRLVVHYGAINDAKALERRLARERENDRLNGRR
jgi:hypothetical protein